MSSGTTDSRLGTSRSQGSPHERIGAFSRTEPKNKEHYIIAGGVNCERAKWEIAHPGFGRIEGDAAHSANIHEKVHKPQSKS